MMKTIKVWDLPTRIFHWLLAIVFVFMIISGEQDSLMEWHFYGGYLLAGLVVFRIIWGVLGTKYSKFKSFATSPNSVFSYLKSIFTKQHKHYVGHTPAGGYMIFVLLGLISIQILTGTATTDDIIWEGPFYSVLSSDITTLAGQVHHLLQNALQVIVGIHVLAIIYYKLILKESLAPAMLHGKKQITGTVAERDCVKWWALLAAIIPGLALTAYLFSLPI